jgi:hypothetical protein
MSRLDELFKQIHQQSHRAAKKHQLVPIVKMHDCPTGEQREAGAQPYGAFIHPHLY